ncbi:MAG: hypothetical protein SV775_15445, partial [Thermodesulfobacteriota bacterium]|nr:hypothetical protein [Thermodesulfobacteriota bacterium]
VSNVPIVGYVLTGKEKSLLIYYFKVKGPLPEPEVQYVPLKNLGSNVVGVFKRLLFTPGRLFKDISKAAKDLAKKGVPVPDVEF